MKRNTIRLLIVTYLTREKGFKVCLKYQTWLHQPKQSSRRKRKHAWTIKKGIYSPQRYSMQGRPSAVKALRIAMEKLSTSKSGLSAITSHQSSKKTWMNSLKVFKKRFAAKLIVYRQTLVEVNPAQRRFNGYFSPSTWISHRTHLRTCTRCFAKNET